MDKKLKIAFLNLYQEQVDRGAETFVREIADRLSKFGHEVVIFNAFRVGVKVDWTRRDMSGTIWRRFFIDYWSGLIALFTLKMLPILWREKFDIVIPLNGGWQPTLVRLVTWLYGGKIVISGQSGMGWDDRNNLWNFPDRFVAISSKAREWAKRVNPFVKTEYIPNGVDLSSFNPWGRKLNFKLSRPIILCVAALTKNKRVDLAIKAVAKLAKASLLVIGDGDLKEEITYLGKKLLKDKFQLAKMPYEKLPAVYRATDIFTLPSVSFHSFEIVLVEAMATNLPVVANDDSIRREIVGDAGLFVNPENTQNYAKALERALNTEWNDKPRRQAEKFSWDEISEKYEKLFKDLINKK